MLPKVPSGCLNRHPSNQPFPLNMDRWVFKSHPQYFVARQKTRFRQCCRKRVFLYHYHTFISCSHSGQKRPLLGHRKPCVASRAHRRDGRPLERSRALSVTLPGAPLLHHRSRIIGAVQKAPTKKPSCTFVCLGKII